METENEGQGSMGSAVEQSKRQLDLTVERSQWIGAQLMKSLMNVTPGRGVISVTLIPLMVGFCWDNANRMALILWLFSALPITVARLFVCRTYRRTYRDAPAEIKAEFVRRLLPLAMVEGAFWGISVWIFFQRIPVVDQFGCWVILTIQVVGPLTRLAFVPRLMQGYIGTLFAVALSGIAYTLVAYPDDHRFHLWFVALILFQWFSIQYQAKSFLRNQTEHFGLQYDLAEKERQALESLDLKSRFLAVATHDLRQPVAALRLYVDFLNDDPEASHELAPKIANATAAVSHLFDSLFDLSSLDSGRVRLTVQPVQIAELMRDLQLQHEPLATAKDIKLRVRACDALIHSDRVRLKRMIGNVLSNAIKYSMPGKQILLAARVLKTGVRIEVWDQGIGIPADQIDKVFDEFYKVAEGAALSSDGVGLGLSLVSRLAKTLQSEVRLQSIVGQGTRCSIRLGDLNSAIRGDWR